MNCGSALEDLKVIDMGRMVAAPFCTAQLADMGADVIKVEAPETGDIARDSLPKEHGISTYFVTFNRSKRGITINLKREEGKEILRRLLAVADVLVENFRPGVMKRLGFSYEEASKINPRLIYASISGFGQTGDYAERACFDPIAQAMSGLMSVTGSADGARVRCGASIADIMAGQNAATAILAALEYRRRTGRGQWIDIALLDTCITALSSMNQVYFTTGKVPAPKGNQFEASAPGNSFSTADGVIVISAGQNAEWLQFAKAMGHAEWICDARFATVDSRVKNRDALEVLISAETVRYSTAALTEKLLAARLSVAPIMSIDKVAKDPYFRNEREMFVDVEHPQLGKVRITNQAIKMSETSPYVRGCSPLLGEHNEEILQQLGYSAAQIAEMTAKGII